MRSKSGSKTARKPASKSKKPAKKSAKAPAKKSAKKPAKKSGKKPKFDPEIVAAHKMYVDAINSNDTDRVMACYDKDAVVMQPDGKEVSGRRGLRKWVNDYFNAFHTHWDKQSKVIWRCGDYGFDQGVDSCVDKPKDGGPVQRYTVKGILIYKRQKDGRWLVYRDIWNFNSPPTVTLTRT